MKISTNWVKQFTDIKIEDDELIRRVGAQLGAIEEVEDWGSYYDPKIVVAEIVDAKDHPDADKLGVYEVKFGDGDNVTVCAGDKTLESGDKVAYIPPGSDVPASIKQGDPFTIGERELRGITSQGMLGSAKELIFGDDHERVIKLDTDAEIGTPLLEAYELDDLIIDVENKMFTHRPDLFGVLGLAREIAGIQDIKFQSPDWYNEEADFPSHSSNLPLEIKNEVPDLCPRFSAVVFDNIKIKPSPQIMQTYLVRVGLRPINNVVDVTNFAMYLTAQPTHAFDYDKIAERSNDTPTLIARKPKSGEKIKLLDGREIEPNSDAAMVATDKELVSVGGSIGGADTEVDENTTKVILEAASWNLYSIRRTSFAHGIFTDAVTRFNKGQSPRQTKIVLGMMVGMFADNCEGELASDLHDEYPKQFKQDDIEISADFVNTRLGSEFSLQDIARILNNTEISSQESNSSIKVQVPFWRADLQVREDLVEEIGRLHGYDNLPIEAPLRHSSPNARSGQLQLKQNIRRSLAAAGAKDILTYNFVSSKMFEKAGYAQSVIDSAYRIRNSLSPELEYMRVSLLPSIIDKVNQNIRSHYDSFALFEVNKAHNKNHTDSELPVEINSIGFAVVSSREQQGSPYYQAKAYLEYLCDELGVTVQYRRATDGDCSTPLGMALKSIFAAQRVAAVEIDGHFAGFVGEFSARAKQKFKLPNYSAGFEIDIDTIDQKRAEYRSISKFPLSTQDVTLETPDQVEYGDLEHLVARSFLGKPFDVTVQPVGIYRAKPGTLRRITFRLTFQGTDRTLKTSEINQAIAEMAAKTADVGIQQI